MRTASSSLLSVRAMARVLLAAVVVGLGLAAAALLQPQSTQAADPIWACYSNSNFSLRSVSGPGDCAGTETAVRLDDSDNPIWICLHPEPGHIRFAGPADDDPITGNCWGAGSTQFFQVPGDNAVTLCVQPSNGLLSYPPCGPNQTQLVIPPRNRAPVAADQNASVDEDDSVTIQLQATDDDGDALTFAIVDGPGNGSLGSITNTACTGTVPNTCTADVDYTPNADFSGDDAFTYTANDGSLDSNVATVSITVNPVNDDPTDIALSSDTVDENVPDGTVVGTFSTSDPDAGDTHTYTLVAGTGDADNGAFTISGSDLSINASPNFEAQSSYSIRVQTDDGNGGTFQKVFTINVNDVNEAPTAITIDSTDIGENRPVGTAVGILSTTDPDAGDTFTYTFATGAGDDDNASFQLDGDRLESAEVFDFEVKNSYTVRIRSTDAGGLFTEEQFTITVVDRNDDPTDIALSNNTIAENVAANFVVGTFSTTDQDVADSHTYSLVAGTGDDDNGAFNILGSDLRITNSPNFEAQASYSIRVQTDDGNGGTFQKVFTITVTDVNEAPTAGTDNYDAIGNTQLRINTPTGPAASVAFTSSGTSPLANDTDPDTNPSFNALQITAAGTCTKGGTLTLNAADHTDGRLTYLPPQGIESANASDTDDCTYTLSDGTNDVSGTVKVRITDLVWYVDNSAAAGGDGRSTAVYDSLAPLTTGGAADALDNANDYIFVFQGNANYTGGFVLESGQRFFGQPNGLTVGATALIAGGGSNPTLTNSGGVGITLANGVDVERIDVTNTSGGGVAGTGVTSATIGNNTSITNTSGNGFDLTGAAGGTVSVGASISNTGGKQVSIQNRTSGTVTFSGAVSGTGTGVALANNTGAAIAFSGGVTLSTGANDAFAATGGGTVEVTGSANTIATTTGTALNVANTSIGSNGLTFRSISAGTGASGPTNGIVLNTTGSSGGLTVTGTGSTGTGGTIQHTGGTAISLTSTSNVSLNYVTISEPGADGISVDAITGFTADHLSISDGAGAAGDRNIQFGDFSAGTAVNGTIAITNSTFATSPHDNVGAGIGSGTSTWTVTGNAFSNNGNTGLNVEFRNAAVVTGMTISGNAFSGAASSAEGIHVQPAGGTTGSLAASILNNTFANHNIAIDVNDDASATATYTISDNSIVNDTRRGTPGSGNTASHAINVFMATTSTSSALMNVRLEDNIIGDANIDGSGSSIGNGMRVNFNGNGQGRVLIDGNTIREAPLGRGIEVIGRNGTGQLDVTITNNDVDHTNLTFDPTNLSDFPLAAIFVQSNCATVCYTVRSDVRGNTVPAGTATDLRSTFLQLVESSTSTLQLVDTAPASADCTAQLTSTNTGSASASAGCALIAGPIITPP